MDVRIKKFKIEFLLLFLGWNNQMLRLIENDENVYYFPEISAKFLNTLKFYSHSKRISSERIGVLISRNFCADKFSNMTNMYRIFEVMFSVRENFLTLL